MDDEDEGRDVYEVNRVDGGGVSARDREVKDDDDGIEDSSETIEPDYQPLGKERTYSPRRLLSRLIDMATRSNSPTLGDGEREKEDDEEVEL